MGSILDHAERMKKEGLAAMLKEAELWAGQLQEYMKAHRVWTDRTGDARKRLKARVLPYEGRGEIVIELAQGVPYGVYLELAHEKRFAIIEPTIRSQSPKVLASFSDLLDKIDKS